MPEAAQTSRGAGVRGLDESYPLALSPGSKRGAATMTNVMLACCSEWGGHVTTEELINRSLPCCLPVCLVSGSSLHCCTSPSFLSGVPKGLPLVPSSDTRRPLCRVHALTLTVDAAPVRLQEVRSAYGSDCCSWLRCCYPACLHVTHCQKSSRRRRSRCHRASALHRERRCRRRGR